MAKKPRKPLPERIKLALHEALAHAKGELTLKTTVVVKSPPADQYGSGSSSDSSTAPSSPAS